jgi:hypothetical protein
MPKTVYFPRVSSLFPDLGVLPTPDEWVKKTGMTFSMGRSQSMLAMDTSYNAFYEEIGKSPQGERYAAQILYGQMNAYLREKGGMWSKCDRNKTSKGMLERIHRVLALQFAGANPNARALSALDNVDIPHARFGVLYLLANISVELSAANYVAMAVEGATALGTIGGLAGSFDVKLNNPAKLADGNAPISLTGKLMESKQVGIGKLGKQDISDLISGGAGAINLGNTLGVKTDGTAVPLHEAIKSKPGAGAAFRHITSSDITRKLAVLKETIVNKIRALVDKVRTKMLADGDWPYSLAGTVLKKLIDSAISKIFAAAAPYVGAGIDIVTGVASTISAIADKLEMRSLRKKFELREGHPKELAEAIEAEMAWDIGAGLKDTLKGSASLVSQIFLPGVGGLVGAIMDGIEWLVGMIMRVAENFRIKEFLAEASKIFAAEPRLSDAEKFVEADRSKGGIVHDTKRFTEFFKKGCHASAIIPMLTLNTGICGSLMMMIRMVNDLGETSQKSFDAGAEYFSSLKTYGAKYMKDSGFSFKARPVPAPPPLTRVTIGTHRQAPPFNREGSIQGLLNHALNSHTVVSTTKSKMLAVLTA